MPRELAQTSPVLELVLLSERQLADSCPCDRPRKGTEEGRWKPASRDRAADRAHSPGGRAERGRGVRGLAAYPQAAAAVFHGRADSRLRRSCLVGRVLFPRTAGL